MSCESRYLQIIVICKTGFKKNGFNFMTLYKLLLFLGFSILNYSMELIIFEDSSSLQYSDLVSGQEVNVFFYNGGWLHDVFILYLTYRSSISIEKLYLDSLSSSIFEYQFYFKICVAFSQNINADLKDLSTRSFPYTFGMLFP